MHTPRPGYDALATMLLPRHITLSEARSRLYQQRFLQPNTHFAAFCEIYKMSSLNVQNFAIFFENSASPFCRSRKMLQNEYLVAKIGVDTAENEPAKVCRRAHRLCSFALASSSAALSGLCVNRPGMGRRLHQVRAHPFFWPARQQVIRL